MKKTQNEKILDHLLKHGSITNAQASRKGVNRLSSIVERLRAKGWFILHVTKNSQRFYSMIKRPNDWRIK